MKKLQYKKAVSMLLAVGMVAGLAACGGTNEAASEGAATEQGGTVEGGSGELDTIKILGINNNNSLSNGKTVSIQDWIDGNYESKTWEKLNADLAEYGIKLEFDLIEPDQYETVIQTKVATGLDCDFVNITGISGQTRRSMVSQGTLVPVNEIWENYGDGTAKEYYENGAGSEVISLNKMEDGNAYWISSFTVGSYGENYQGALQGLLIRKDWVEKLGRQMPATADELYETLIAFRDEDVNGNGQADEMVNITYDSFDNGIAQMFGLGNDLVFVDPATGVASSPWYQDSFAEYVAYMAKLYQEGLLETSGQGYEKKQENKIGLLKDWWGATWDNTGIAVAEGDEAAYFCGILPKVSDEIQPRVNAQAGVQKMNLDFAVTKNADKEVMGRFFDYLSSDEYALLAEYGIEGYSYEVKDGKIIRMNLDDSANEELQIVSRYPNIFVNNAILPRYEMADRDGELINCVESGFSAGYPEEGYQAMADRIREVYDNPDDYAYVYSEMEPNLAVATEEEQERTTDIKADLDTYYKEALTALIFGTSSMDDLDEYVSKMKELGLDELVEIVQARYDRAHK